MMSKYFSEGEIEYIINDLMSPGNHYDPLPEPLLEYANFGKVLDTLVEQIVYDIKDEPATTLYSRRDLGRRYDAAEEKVLEELKAIQCMGDLLEGAHGN
jgi:hypothetical protein